MEKLFIAFIGGVVGAGASLLFVDKPYAFFNGSLVAFQEKCPEGWIDYAPANGRFLLAAGQGEGLVPRVVGQRGGVDEVGYTAETQYYEITSNVSGGGVINPDRQPRSISFETTKVDMPPYLVVKLCSYSPEN